MIIPVRAGLPSAFEFKMLIASNERLVMLRPLKRSGWAERLALEPFVQCGCDNSANLLGRLKERNCVNEC